jgi:hypothetical protein
LSRLDGDGRTILVCADIVDFYRSINLRTLDIALQKYGVETWLIERAFLLLRTWEPSIGGGIPIGPSASHIFAEAVLMSIDDNLAAQGVAFVRYLDDYRMFAPDIATAQRCLSLLASCLRSQGFEIDSSKSVIGPVSRADYARYLVDRENNGGLSGLERLAQVQSQERAKQPDRSKVGPKKQQPKDGWEDSGSAPRCKRLRTCKEQSRPPVNSAAFLQSLKQDDDLTIDDFRLLLELSFSRGEFEVVKECAHLTVRSTHLLPYFVEFAIREQDTIPPEIRRSISEYFGKRYRDFIEGFELWFILKLLSSAGYANEQVFCDYFQVDLQEPINARAFVDGLHELNLKDTAVPLLNSYEHLDAWTQRALLRAVLPHVDEQMRLALFARATGNGNFDPFLRPGFANVGII